MNKIPVTLITGFLGAGKTSLLNHLVERYPDKKFAIIENEIGEENIDQELITNIANDDIFELSNGCICCSLNQDLLVLLQKLSDSSHKFNHLLIETTGIADPGSILASFISDPIIKNQFELDSVICLVDAKNVKSDLQNSNILSKQIAIADLILINKIDLIDKIKEAEIVKTIRSHNSFAKLEKCIYSQPNITEILDVFSYQADKIIQHIISIENNSNTKSKNKHEIENMLFICTQALDQMKLGMWLEAFLRFNQDTIYRVKGIVNIAGMNNRIILQSVHTEIQASIGALWQESDIRESKIVIIGKDLNRPIIEKNLNELIA